MEIINNSIDLDEQKKIREEISERWKKIENSKLKFEPVDLKYWSQYDGMARIIEETIKKSKDDN